MVSNTTTCHTIFVSFLIQSYFISEKLLNKSPEIFKIGVIFSEPSKVSRDMETKVCARVCVCVCVRRGGRRKIFRGSN